MIKPLSIYIHVPFCVKKCLYCDFLSFPATKALMERYLEALKREIRLSGNKYSESEVTTIFLGGGTPSYPDADFVISVMEELRSNFTISSDAEISMEMNPGTESKEKLLKYRAAGINRLSIGCQSLNDNELHEIGRIHTSKDFYRCFQDARDAGFDNINIDIMSALPGQNTASYHDTLSKVVALKPEHVSAYSLIIEPGTELYNRYGDTSIKDLYDVDDTSAKQNGLSNMKLSYPLLPSEDDERAMYYDSVNTLSGNGYHRYEISNFALNGESDNFEKYECRHNEVYWRRGDYIGFGIGAASFVSNMRFSNIRDIDKYLLFNSLDDIHTDVQKLTIHDQMEEFMFLGFRMSQGVSFSEFEKYFHFNLRTIYGKVIDRFIDEGLLEETSTNLRLTDKGIDVSNFVMAQFLFDDEVGD